MFGTFRLQELIEKAIRGELREKEYVKLFKKLSKKRLNGGLKSEKERLIASGYALYEDPERRRRYIEVGLIRWRDEHR